MEVTLDIPDLTPLILNNDIQELKHIIKLNSALMLFKNSKFSIEQASNFSNLTISEFMNECKKNQISTISYSEDELLLELEAMKKIDKLQSDIKTPNDKTLEAMKDVETGKNYESII